MFGRQPCKTCGSRECGDAPFVWFWVPTWMVSFGIIVAVYAADVAYSLAVR